ncbi:MAG: phosphoglycerate mutase [Chloroflexi bacterium 44-23]|nr:MAG: phosphoglycerate mutase [Chloroflexi bacterium 44-23]
MNDELLQKLIQAGNSKIVMIIMDGLGGLAREVGGKTELESAHRPNLNKLAQDSALGLTIPIEPGVTTGSGPGHLAFFGYDPLEYEIGRGALEALGVDFDLHPDDIAARGNFCTIGTGGNLIDRRAGRLPNEESIGLIEQLRTIKVDGVEFFIEPIKEHRFAYVIRGLNLGAALEDSDPLINGAAPLAVQGRDDRSNLTAEKINLFIMQAKEKLSKRSSANMILLRGFAKLPTLPSYRQRFKLKAAAIAINGMYKGVSRLLGMDILEVPGQLLADQFEVLEKNWENYDFFYLHFKRSDTCGENGDFEGKVAAIEEMDSFIPRLMALNPDVVIVGGDHSTPAILKSHSWHPVPLLLYSERVRSDNIKEFGERACSQGSLGLLKATEVMPLALANAGRLAKYGA